MWPIVSILVIFVHLAASDLSASDARKLRDYRVVPDVIFNTPLQALDVKFTNARAQMGNELTPTEDQPSVTWDADDCAFYTLVMIDVDIPEYIGAKEVQHWLVVNIPGNNISKGQTLFDYEGSEPPKDSGLHRYILLVYKQPYKFDRRRYRDIRETSDDSRLQYTLNGLRNRFCLWGRPVAGNFFRAQFEQE